MAQAVLARDVPPEWSVRSAGLAALVGEGAAPEALRSLRAKGLDATAHRARQLNPDMLRESELVLVMEAAQQDRLETGNPWVRGRVYRLGHWDRMEIEDPYRKPQAIFDATLEAISGCCASWIARLP